MSRFIDRGAQVAAWIGVGTAVVVVVAFGLVLPIQPIVYVAAFPAGLLIGWYANSKAERFRPRGRALANALWAGLLTALTLSIFYVGVRLVFIYGDNGYPDFNRTDKDGQPTGIQCAPGPDCVYQRYVAQGHAPELAAAGINDEAAFGRFLIADELNGAALLFGLTMAGAAVAGVWQSVRPLPGVLRVEPVSST